MKKLILGVALFALAAFGVIIFSTRPASEPPPGAGPPWRIETLPDGTSRVFGLVLGQSTFADARGPLGPDMQVAVIAAPRETGTLEAYYEQASVGGITGRLILVADVSKDEVVRLRDRALKWEYMESATKRFILDPSDLSRVHAARVAGITFIPSVNLDPDTVLSRFGPPKERIRANEHVEHLLYPETGLDVVLDDRGKEVLQYVAPRDFQRLRQPLLEIK